MDEYTRPDYQHIALITIDVQNDFSLPGTPLEIKGTMEIVPQIAGLLRVFRAAARPIVHIIRLYDADGRNADIVRRKWVEGGVSAVRPGSSGAELVDALKPNDRSLDAGLLMRGEAQELARNEYVIYKPRWGAFYQTPLEKFLKKHKINTLAFTGCNFPNCPRTSIYQASERDFRLVVVRDALSGVYEKGVEELKNIGCEMMTAHELELNLKSA
jgi:nicotinamidase-related amidase